MDQLYTSCKGCGDELDNPVEDRDEAYCGACADPTIEEYDVKGDR